MAFETFLRLEVKINSLLKKVEDHLTTDIDYAQKNSLSINSFLLYNNFYSL